MRPRNSGPERDRTADLLDAIQALSQLSYQPESSPSPARRTRTGDQTRLPYRPLWRRLGQVTVKWSRTPRVCSHPWAPWRWDSGVGAGTGFEPVSPAYEADGVT